MKFSTTKFMKFIFKATQLAFNRQKDKKRDRFAVAGQTILPGAVFHSSVGHIPIELSQYIWYALQREAEIRGEVISVRYKSSPLIQDGLEIPTEVTVKWEDKKAMDILHKKVEEVSYPLGDNDRCIDESKAILKSIMNEDVSTDSDGEVDEM